MKPADHGAPFVAAKSGFNYHKLQAASCMLASAAVSIGLTWFAISRLF